MSLIIDEEQNKNKYFTKEKIEKALDEFIMHQSEAQEAFRNNVGEFGYMIDDEYDDNLKVNMVLGGNSGFWSKTIVYALSPDKQSAIKALSEMFSKKFRQHKHDKYDMKTAPHILKMINDNGEYVPIGLCNIKLEEQ